MIDPQVEEIMPLSEIPKIKWLQRPRGGSRISYHMLHRWARHGSRGVKLETVCVGRTMYTSAEAVSRFIEHCSSSRSPEDDARSITQAAADAETEKKLRKLGAV